MEPATSTSESTDDRTRVITVRLPSAIHERLKSEAYRRKTSLNKLCVETLAAIVPVQSEVES